MVGLLIFILIFLFIVLLLSFYTVEQQTNAIVESFGKFSRVARPGLNMKIPLVERISGRINLKVQQLDVDVETKTKDNVFVHVIVSVQYYVLTDKVYDAFYRLDNPEAQITSFIFDTVRAEVPLITIDDVFEKKDDIAVAVKKELSEVMDNFGYGIIKALVTDINPDQKVKDAMNEINAQERLKAAAEQKAQGQKIMVVRAAEAEAESKILQGQGVAGQRKAIIEGLRESITDFQSTVDGADAREALNLVLMTQYFDTLKDIGAQSKTNTIIVPHGPGTMTDIKSQITEAMLTVDASIKSK